MEINIDCCLNCPTGLHGPTQRAIDKTKLEKSASLLPLSSGKNLTPNKSTNQQINLNGHSSPAQSNKLPQSALTSSNLLSNGVIHPHKKSKLWKQVGKLFSFNRSQLHREVSKPSSPAKVNSEASAVHVNDITVRVPIHCCELDRRSESLINHYREVFNYSPEGERELLEQRKRLVAALTPCTFVRSSDQWKQIKDVLQEVINSEAPYTTNNSDEFVPVGDLFISAHRFMEVQFSSGTQILPDPKSTIALPFPAKCVNWLTPATESEICADVDLRDLIGLSSIWFVYVDSDLLADTNIKSANEYDRYAKQLLTDLFTKGSFGLVGDQHNLIVPLIFDLDSKTLNTSLIPSNLRPFCGVITGDGLHLGKVVLELVIKLFSFILNELFLCTSIKNFYGTRSEITIIPDKIISQIENLRISIFLYYMDLRLLSVQTKFACLENTKVKKREMETDSSPLQYLLNLIEFGNNIIRVNSNLLLQAILQNRYQFKIEQYWIYSIRKEQTENDQIKEITNALESTFGKILMIISNIKKLDITFSAEKLSKIILKLCLSFLHIFFQDCDFSLNEEITVVYFNSETKQYLKNTEKITLNCLKNMLLFNPRQTKQLSISFVDFFQLMHHVLEQFTPKQILQEWIPVLHCELQLIFNKLLWLEDSHNSNYPDFYFTFPIPMGKNRSDLSWRHLLKALNVIATCCERMNLPNNDLLFITVCEVLYQIFLPHYNFSTKSANKNLDPKWRLIEFRASRTSTQELSFHSEFKSIDWEPVGNVFQLLLMHFWSKPPDILQVQVLTSFLNNLFKKGSANLSDNNAGILRFSGMIASHAAIRELGSNISLVNDSRFDSLHFLIPRILFRPKQLVDNFEDLQKQAWDENPFRFLIQYQLEKSERDDTRELEPPWQYSTVTLSSKLLKLHDASFVHSTEDLQEHGTTPSAATQLKQVVFDDALQERSDGVQVKTVKVRSIRKHSDSQNAAYANGFDALDLPTRTTTTVSAFQTSAQNTSTSRSRSHSHTTMEPPEASSPSQTFEKHDLSTPLVEEQQTCSDKLEISSQAQSENTETSTAAASSNATPHITTDLQLEIVTGLSIAGAENPSSEATRPMQTTRVDDAPAVDQYQRFVVVVESGRRRVIFPADNVFRGLAPEREQSPGPDADNTIDVSILEAAAGGGSTTTLHLHCPWENLDTEKADNEDPLSMNASCLMNTNKSLLNRTEHK